MAAASAPTGRKWMVTTIPLGQEADGSERSIQVRLNASLEVKPALEGLNRGLAGLQSTLATCDGTITGLQLLERQGPGRPAVLTSPEDIVEKMVDYAQTFAGGDAVRPDFCTYQFA